MKSVDLVGTETVDHFDHILRSLINGFCGCYRFKVEEDRLTYAEHIPGPCTLLLPQVRHFFWPDRVRIRRASAVRDHNGNDRITGRRHLSHRSAHAYLHIVGMSAYQQYSFHNSIDARGLLG